MDVPIGETPEVTVPRAEETLLKAAVPLEHGAERYTRQGREHAAGELREQLTLTWFVESGDTDEERTRWVEGGFRAEKTFENEWSPTASRTTRGTPPQVIVVIRDNRGGVDWRGAAVRLGATP